MNRDTLSPHLLRWSTYLAGVWAVLCMVACSDNDAETLPVMPPESDLPIRWDVQSVEGMQGETRGLIEDQNALQTACTPVANGGEGEGIGIWADYDITIGGVDQTVNNVFGNTKLMYFDKAGGNPHSWWNYEGTDLYWAIGGEYIFRAYYPQSVSASVVSSSDANLFIVDYNSETTQKDLMVAYNKIDTKTYNLNEPVPLQFKHTLAALKFRFQFSNDYDDNDKLTACWLVNDADDAFSTVGLMAYGDNDPSDDTGGIPNKPEELLWKLSYYPPAGMKLYHWEHDTGLPFYKDKGKDSSGNDIDGTEKAVAYTDPAGSSVGASYATNDGWLLILPQKSTGKLRLCFTTERSGDVVYSTLLPAVTGTDESGKSSSGTWYIRSYRYTYTVSISRTDLKLTLGIAPWNRMESSYDISF